MEPCWFVTAEPTEAGTNLQRDPSHAYSEVQLYSMGLPPGEVGLEPNIIITP